jgi:hypothetical protein
MRTVFVTDVLRLALVQLCTQDVYEAHRHYLDLAAFQRNDELENISSGMGRRPSSLDNSVRNFVTVTSTIITKHSRRLLYCKFPTSVQQYPYLSTDVRNLQSPIEKQIRIPHLLTHCLSLQLSPIY